jgi:imidazolonepropionase
VTTLLITNIGELVTNEPTLGDGSPLGLLRDAALVLEDGHVAWVGRSEDAPATDDRVDAGCRAVVPGFVDSHTHLVFAGERSAEFAARMAGKPYTGGGIATTVGATRAATDAQLRAHARGLFAEMISLGTTTVEIKSGYGLTVADEARILRIAGEITPETTFLGAHVVPPEYANDRAAYVALVRGDMLSACAPLARWIDAFCEVGAFDEDESREVLTAGIAAGLLPRLHGNQLGLGPGVRLAVELDAAAVDHCSYLSDADVVALAGSDTVATLLPGADFGIRGPYADARRLIDAGAKVAIATDCNPGTSFVTSMPFMIALAVRELHMTPAEALLAATRGGAAALRRDDVGHLGVGARADVVMLDGPSHVHLAYRPGAPVVEAVWREGALVHQRPGVALR